MLRYPSPHSILESTINNLINLGIIYDTKILINLINTLYIIIDKLIIFSNQIVFARKPNSLILWILNNLHI